MNLLINYDVYEYSQERSGSFATFYKNNNKYIFIDTWEIIIKYILILFDN